MIEFVNNEDYCRWKGVQMTDDEHLKQFGAIFNDLQGDLWFINDNIYIDSSDYKDAIIKFLKSVSDNVIKTTYDNDLDKVHGFGNQAAIEVVEINDNLFKAIDMIKLFSEEPDSKNWNLSKMLEFHNDLIQYYKKYEHDTIS